MGAWIRMVFARARLVDAVRENEMAPDRTSMRVIYR